MSKGDGEGGSAYPKSVQAGIPKLSNPAGWPVVRIGDIFKVVQRPVDLQDDAEYQLVTAKRNRGGVVPRERLTGKAILTKSQFRIAAGDFLISRRQIAHGACGIVPEALAGAIVSNEYATLLPTDLLDPGFMHHLPESIYFQQTCFHSSIGVHVEKLVFNLEDWLRWPLPLPAKAEQKRIVALLDTFDDMAKINEDLANLKNIEIEAFRRKLLLRTDRQSVRLSEIAAINPRTPFLPPEASVTFLGMEDVSEAGVVLRRRLMRRGDLGNGYTAFQDGDVLVAKITPCFENGKGALVDQLEGGFGFGSTEFHVVRARGDTCASFLAHHTRAPRFRRIGEQHMSGSAGQKRVPKEFLEDYRVPSLSVDEQIRAASILDDATVQARSYADLAELCRRQKRGLMQKLLTGEWQVPENIDRLMPGGDAAAALVREASAA